ncbi:SRPBCC domain-containing protein [Ferruginibacter sp.]
MQQHLVVSQSVNVKASVEQVWKVLTEPAFIAEYLFGTETVTDWKVGSDIIFQGAYGDNKEFSYRDKGVILENVPYKKLSYSYWSGFSGLEDKPENYATVTYTIDKIDADNSIFTWTQKGYATEEGYQHSLQGMTSFLEQIKTIMER